MSQNFFTWDNDFNTGNEIVDAQHYNLVEMINDLFDISISSQSIKLDTFDSVRDELSSYVINHFSTEEELMRKYSVDSRHCEEHQQSHKDFVREITKQLQVPENLTDPYKIKNIVEYLIRWLAYHILNTDKSLFRQISYITNDKMTPAEAYNNEIKTNEITTEPLLKALKVLYLLVSSKNKEIEQKNAELEEKVKHRTAELSKANDKLSQMLFQDVLTGLPNRRYVMDEIQKQVNNWERYNIPFSVLFIDIDKFKAVNDNYGHENGDKVLKWIADFLCLNIRKTDIACRLGGDEFVVICSNTDTEGALSVGKKLNELCNNIEQKYEFWKPSLSIGIFTVNNHVVSPSDILNAADNAMYASKNKGGGTTSLARD